MEEEKCFVIPYESAVAALERTIKRLWILCLMLAVFLVLSNAAWIYYESQFVDSTTEATITQDLDAGDGGSITNGSMSVNGKGEADN